MSAFSRRRSPVWRYVAAGVAVVVVVLLIGFFAIVHGPGATDFAGGKRIALSDFHGANPTGVPPELAGADIVQRGQYLARAADCAACHTAKGGVPYAGGLAFVLPFGTLYSSNITPDKDTGIGDYTDADFLKALHEGIFRGGGRLYPAMPYPSFAAMTDDDALAIKAYLFSLAPVNAPTPDNTFRFPFNQRWGMGIWSLLFNPDKRFEPVAERDAQWNRGAYLVEAMAHCGECHTPRNLAQALNNRQKFAGAVQAGWRAYNITADRDSGVGAWSDNEIAQFLAVGHADGRGPTGGPMAEAVDKSFQYMTPGDITAMVAYVRTVPALATSDLPAPKPTPAPASHRDGVAANFDPRGKAIFEGACASCHDWTGVSPLTPFATLTGDRAVNDPSATNVAQIIIGGADRRTPAGRAFMPAFGQSYSNTEIAAVANYVTARFGAKPSAIAADEVAKLREMQ
jgi:mono/diheme cytochrome c family protein